MKSDADTASDPNAAPAEQTGEGTENMSEAEADPEHEESAENEEGGTEKTSTARTIEKIEDHLYALRIGMDEQVSLESILDEIGMGLESVQISTDTAELLVEDGQIRCTGTFEEGSILLTAGDINVTILCTFDSGSPEGTEEATEQEAAADASEVTDGNQDQQGEHTDSQDTEPGQVAYIQTFELLEENRYAVVLGLMEGVQFRDIPGLEDAENVTIETDIESLEIAEDSFVCRGSFAEGTVKISFDEKEIILVCRFRETAEAGDSDIQAAEDTEQPSDGEGEEAQTREDDTVKFVQTFEMLEDGRYAVELGILEGVQIRDIPGLEDVENVIIETDIESLEVSDDSIVCTGAFEEGTVSISSGDLTVILVCRYVERQDSAGPEVNADADAALDDAQEYVTYIHTFEALDENRYAVELGMLEGVMVRDIPGLEDTEDVNVQTEIENLEVHDDSIVCRGPFEEGIVTVSSTEQDIILVCRYVEREENDAETGNTDDKSLDENSGVKLTGDEAGKIQAVMQPENADAVVELVKQALQIQAGNAEENLSEGTDDEEALQHVQAWRVLSLTSEEALEGTVEVSCPMDIVYQEMLPEGTELTSVNVQLYHVDLETGEVLPVTNFQIIGDSEHFERFVFSTDRPGTWALVCTLEYAWIHQYYDMYLDLSGFEADPTMDEDLQGIHVLTETVSAENAADEQVQDDTAETADAEATDPVDAEAAENGSAEAEALQENPDTEPGGETEEGTAVESKVTGISVDLKKLLQALEAEPETAELQGIAIHAGGEAQIQLETDALTVESTEGSVSFENGQIRILGDGALTIRGHHISLTVNVSGFAVPETQKTYDFTFAGTDAVPMREIFAQSGLSDHFDPAAFEYELSDPEKVSMILDGENWYLKANDWFENVTLSVRRSWYSADVSLHYPQGMTMAGTVFASEDGCVTMELLEDALIPQNTALEAAPCEGTDISDRIVEDFASLEYRQNAWIDIRYGELQEVRAAITLHGVIDVPENLKPYVSITQVKVYRLDGEEISVLDASVSGTDVTFETDRLSAFCVVYAFEYDWKVDGQAYAWTLSEDGYVSLGQLVKSLGIVHMAELVESDIEKNETSDVQETAADTETQEAEEYASDINPGENVDTAACTENADSSAEEAKPAEDTEETRHAQSSLSDGAQLFLKHVNHVSWSNPENGWTGKMKETVFVGDLKELYSLDCRYPESVTEEQILELNRRTVDADDWALIRLMPYNGEETLTVEMDNGETFTVRISDMEIRQTVLTAGGDTYGITVTCDVASGIPETAELVVREIVEGDPEYPEYYAKASEHVNQHGSAEDDASVETENDEAENAAQVARQKIHYARFFDMEIRDNGEKIEPTSPVKVQIRLMDAPKDVGRAPEVIHFADNGTETMKISKKEEEVPEVGIEEKPMMLRSRQKLAKAPTAMESTVIEFSADGFSVYSVVYTVDFHYEVNGKMYEFSIPGGGFASFYKIVEVLGIGEQSTQSGNGDENATENSEIGYGNGEKTDGNGENTPENAVYNVVKETDAEDTATYNEPLSLNNVEVSEATKKFVADVASVEFSSPELVWVGKVEAETTVGRLKEADGLEVQYSSELTEEQIAEINGTVVESGDWAMISVLPFDTEESLTVTMKTGEQFIIMVTDYQISTNVLTADGQTYKITVTYDDDAEIPDGTKLIASEIAPGTDEYIQHLGQAWAEVNKEYFEVEEMRENYDESMGELPDVPYININTARFFDISLIYNDKVIEPKAPVRVEISYVQGLEAWEETTPGVAHYVSETQVEIIEDVETIIRDNEVTSFRYEQESFSDVGTYVGQEIQDSYVEPKLAAAPDPNGITTLKSANLTDEALNEVVLSSLKSSDLLRAGETEQSDENDHTDLKKPEAHKNLTPNKDESNQEDGTYTLTLSVKGHSSVTTETTVKKSNVLVVMDRSSSMITKTVSDDSTRWYYGTKNTSSWRGDLTEGNGYHFIGVVNGQEVDLIVSYNWQDGGSWSNPVITYQSGTDWWGNPQYSNYPDNSPIYVVSKKTRMTAEQEALSTLFTQLMENNNASDANTDVVEISVISFGDERFDDKSWSSETEIGWQSGRDTSALMGVVNSNRFTSGTNWEEALQYAYEIINSKKTAEENAGNTNEDYYVIFLTDGEPTAIEGESGSAYHTTDPITGAITNGNGNIYAYEESKDAAKALVDAGFAFYNIFTFRTTEDEKYSIYLTNYAYGNGNQNGNTNTDAVKNYFEDARTIDSLTNKFNDIFNTIEDSIGHGNVSITDTLTTDAMTTTVVHGKTNGYVYEVRDGSGTLVYTVTATGELSDPTVVFNVPASSTKDYTATSSTVGGKTVYSVTTAEGKVLKMALADISDDTGELVWDLSPVGLLLDNYTYSVNFVVWPDQDAYDYVAALNNGLETITDSSNTTVDVVWNQGSATPVTGSAGTYYKGGCSKYPSIVYYPGTGDDYENGVYHGTFAVLTNTDQKLHYSVIETVTTNGTTETEITGPFYHELENPDPMPLAHTQSLLYKQWNVDRDPEILLRLLYEFDGEEPVYDENNNLIPTRFTIGFDILQDTNTTPYDTVGLGWNGEDYVWDTSDPDSLKTFEYKGKEYTISTRWMNGFSIATGLMLSGERMDAIGLDRSAYPSGEYTDGEGHTTTYYLLEDGHDYTIKENNVSYEFDFEAPVYHPMLVDGTLRNVNFTKTDNGTTINYTEISPLNINPVTDTSSLEIVNTLRGYIHLNKKVVGSDGATEITDDTTEFEYTVELNNANALFTIEGSHIPWYGISELYYHDEDGNYYQARPVGSPMENGNPNGPKKYLSLTLETEAGDIYNATCENGFDPDAVGPSVIKYTVGAEEKTIQLYGNQMEPSEETLEGIGEYKRAMATIRITRSQQLNIANVPINTTYKIIETDANGYHLIAIERQTGGGAAVQAGNVGTATITGTIIPNSETNITYTNRCDVITIQKLDGNGNGLEGAVFQIKAVNGLEESLITNVDGIGEVIKVVDGEEKTFKSAFETTGGAQRIAGLPNGTYRLREVYVPAGYISTVSHIDFKIENHVMSMITDDDSLEFVPASVSGGNAKLALLKITNTPGAALPNTGGPGTNRLYLFGIMLTGLAGAGLVMKRRRKEVA